jgi:hypothetical protein
VYDPDHLGPIAGPVAYGTLAVKKAAIVFEGHSEANGGVVVYDSRTGDEPARTVAY